MMMNKKQFMNIIISLNDIFNSCFFFIFVSVQLLRLADDIQIAKETRDQNYASDGTSDGASGSASDDISDDASDYTSDDRPDFVLDIMIMFGGEIIWKYLLKKFCNVSTNLDHF